MSEETIQQIILGEIRDIKENQTHQGKQLSSIELRLGIIERDCSSFSDHLDKLNGCTGELATELDELTSIEQCRSHRKRSRKEKIYLACKIIGAICGIGGLVVAIIL